MPKQVHHSQVAGSNWKVWQTDDGLFEDHQVTRAILLDIRAELQKLNTLLHCPNFVAIPAIMRDVRKNTTKRKPKRKVRP